MYATDTSDVFVILPADFLTLAGYFSSSDHSSGYSFHVIVLVPFS